MAVNLSKGQRVSLDKGIKMALVGLGWDPNRYDGGYDFDLDASAFMLGKNGKVLRDDDFIFYGNQEHRTGAVKSMGDDTTGGNSEEGDDEQIFIDFSKIPPEIEKIAITVTIYDAPREKTELWAGLECLRPGRPHFRAWRQRRDGSSPFRSGRGVFH